MDVDVVQELPSELCVDSEAAAATLRRCQRQVETDRAVMLKSTKAAISWPTGSLRGV